MLLSYISQKVRNIDEPLHGHLHGSMRYQLNRSCRSLFLLVVGSHWRDLSARGMGPLATTLASNLGQIVLMIYEGLRMCHVHSMETYFGCHTQIIIIYGLFLSGSELS